MIILAIIAIFLASLFAGGLLLILATCCAASKEIPPIDL